MLYLALALFVALQVADIVTTLPILNSGGRELNPVVKWFIVRLGPVSGLVAIKLLSSAVLVWAVCSGAVGALFVFVLCALYVVVVGNNLSQTLK